MWVDQDELAGEIIEFRDNRDWARFHTPANLAASISIEAAELLECFQWGKEPTKDAVADEVADILIYIYTIAHELDIDTNAAILNKLRTNERRYPVDKARGNAKKYTEL
jgi:NTP pyrophosphatase (non-canonical NTP hydrolase)